MHWYKLAKSCQEYEKYAIDNLPPDFVEKLNNPRANKDFVLNVLLLEPGFTNKDIEEAKRCLRRLWHPDVNPQNRETAEALFKALNVATDFAKSLIGEGHFEREEYDDYYSDIFSPSQGNAYPNDHFENVIRGYYKGEKNEELFIDTYSDMSDIPAELYKTPKHEDYKLDVIFNNGKYISAKWRNRAGYIWVHGNFSTLEDANQVNLWQYSFNGAAQVLAYMIANLAFAGILVQKFVGSKEFYNRVRKHLEQMARDMALRASSMGHVNWSDMESKINAADLNEIKRAAEEAQKAINSIMRKYYNEYGNKISNRFMPWSKKWRENYEIYHIYPILSDIGYIPGWVDRILKTGESYGMDEQGLKDRLYERIRRQVEDVNKIYPVKNPNSEAYKVVSKFYEEIDAAIDDFIRAFTQ